MNPEPAAASDRHGPPGPVIVGLSGYAGSNKETVADLLTADPYMFHTRNVVELVNTIAASIDETWAGPSGPDARATMWRMSHQLRQVFGDDILIRHALRWPLPPRLVVVGVRRQVEADQIRARGGVVVRLTRPGLGPADADEAALPDAELTLDASDISRAATATARYALTCGGRL